MSKLRAFSVKFQLLRKADGEKRYKPGYITGLILAKSQADAVFITGQEIKKIEDIKNGKVNVKLFSCVGVPYDFFMVEEPEKDEDNQDDIIDD